MKALRRLGVTVVAALMTLYIVNVAAIYAFTPKQHVTGTAIGSGGTRVVYVDGLTPGPLFNSNVIGYVNVADKKNEIYFDAERLSRLSPREKFFLNNHESFHVKQKQVAADRAGGYPSKWNPARTAKYARELLRIELAFRKNIPDNDAPWLTRGIETSSDCYAQYAVFTSGVKLPDKVNSYFDEPCNPRQMLEASQFMEHGILPGE